MELADVIPQPESGVTSRRARVISVSGRMLTVDLGGGITIPSVDSCNPVPDQWVLIQVEGSSMIATGAIAGEYKQATVKVTANSLNSVTGLVNGVSREIFKAGAFTAAVGDILPLIWPADSSSVWVGGVPGNAYVPPPDGGGSTGGGGGIASGTATYAATSAGTYAYDNWYSGAFIAGGGSGIGAFFYGGGRFRELQGRTIAGFRVNLAGGGTASMYGHPHASRPGGAPTLGYGAGSVSAGGWRSLPIGLANYLIAGSGTGGLAFTGGYAGWSALPYGTLQFDWRR